MFGRRARKPKPSTGLTRGELEQADNIVQLVIDRVLQMVGEVPYEKQPDFVRSLSSGLRMIWGTFCVDSEVNNGGFIQFFWNHSGLYVAKAREGYLLIGATEHLRLLDEAVARFEQEAERLGPYYEEGTMESFRAAYGERVFDDLDNRFFQLTSDHFVAEYIRANLDEFTGAP